MLFLYSKIEGITIEIGGDSKPLEKALSNVNKTSRSLQSELREVEKPKILKDAQSEVNKQFAEDKVSEEQYRSFNCQIEKTSIELNQLETSADKVGNEVDE